MSAARHAVGVLARIRFAVSGAWPAGSVLVDGVPETFRVAAQAVVDSVAGSAGAKAEALKERFPCVADVVVRRSWGEKRATLTPILRRAVAPVLRGGRPVGYLGEDGVVFAAPAGVFVLAGPAAEVSGASEGELGALAREWPVLASPRTFSAPLAVLAYRSAEDGWQARLADGTTELWGRLDWTKEKLERLSEAVNDAKTREPGPFSADLRFFEDGKVLLKPRGGVR